MNTTPPANQKRCGGLSKSGRRCSGGAVCEGTATHPENTNDIERAQWATVGLDHTEHAVQLPTSEEDNEKVVGVPKLFETSIGLSSALFDRKPNHDREGGSHDPTGDTSSGGKVENEELNRSRGRARDRVDSCELSEVPHVCEDVHCGKGDNGPCGGNVELDVIIKRNDIVQGRLAEERDEVAANWEKDPNDIEMEDECGGTGDCWTVRSKRWDSKGGYAVWGKNVPKPTLIAARVPVKVSLSW